MELSSHVGPSLAWKFAQGGGPAIAAGTAPSPGGAEPEFDAPAAGGKAAGPEPAHLLLFVGEAIRPDAALASLLAREGLRCLGLPGAEQALRAASLARFDAVLIDARLVDGRGARAIETLASTHRCPVIVLADEPDEVDEIMALEFGADLYLARPLPPRRLRAHLAALLRRRAAASLAPGAPGTVCAAGWTLDVPQQRLTRGATALRLTPAQTALLSCLMSAAGAIVPAETLLAVLPGQDQARPGSLRIHVHRLRQRLREEGAEALRLEAVRGSGYALVMPAHPMEQAA
ncbi:MAG: response regulator transcription factor [Rubrivivax sp.]|nr:response regulator transcription factor [Rubrivivax sp.]